MNVHLTIKLTKKNSNNVNEYLKLILIIVNIININFKKFQFDTIKILLVNFIIKMYTLILTKPYWLILI